MAPEYLSSWYSDESPSQGAGLMQLLLIMCLYVHVFRQLQSGLLQICLAFGHHAAQPSDFAWTSLVSPTHLHRPQPSPSHALRVAPPEIHCSQTKPDLIPAIQP